MCRMSAYERDQELAGCLHLKQEAIPLNYDEDTYCSQEIQIKSLQEEFFDAYKVLDPYLMMEQDILPRPSQK